MVVSQLPLQSSDKLNLKACAGSTPDVRQTATAASPKARPVRTFLMCPPASVCRPVGLPRNHVAFLFVAEIQKPRVVSLLLGNARRQASHECMICRML